MTHKIGGCKLGMGGLSPENMLLGKNSFFVWNNMLKVIIQYFIVIRVLKYLELNGIYNKSYIPKKEYYCWKSGFLYKKFSQKAKKIPGWNRIWTKSPVLCSGVLRFNQLG